MKKRCECGCGGEFESTRPNRRFYGASCRQLQFWVRRLRKAPVKRHQEARQGAPKPGNVYDLMANVDRQTQRLFRKVARGQQAAKASAISAVSALKEQEASA